MKTLAKAYKEQFGSVKFPFKIYDSNGNVTYFEDSDGYWWKREYDGNGKVTYSENSYGIKKGTPRAASCDGKVITVDGNQYKLTEL